MNTGLWINTLLNFPETRWISAQNLMAAGLQLDLCR